MDRQESPSRARGKARTLLESLPTNCSPPLTASSLFTATSSDENPVRQGSHLQHNIMNQSNASGLRVLTNKPHMVFCSFQNMQRETPTRCHIELTEPSVNFPPSDLKEKFAPRCSSQHTYNIPRIVFTQAEFSDEFIPSFSSQTTYNTPCIILTGAVLTDESTLSLTNQAAANSIPEIIVTTPESMIELPIYDFDPDCYSDFGCGHDRFCTFLYAPC